MSDEMLTLEQKIASFRKKYYKNILLKGCLLTLTIVAGYFLLVSVVEYNLWLGKPARFTLFILFFLLLIFCLYHFLKEPILWWVYKKGLGSEESATLIGKFFPSVGDRLLNSIQLSAASSSKLVEASIVQKAASFKELSFEKAVDFKTNTNYLRYLGATLIIILILVIIDRNIFTQSTHRIVRFNQEFSPQAPFQFYIQNKELLAYFNEDFTLQVSVDGYAIPDAVYINIGGQRKKMETVDAHHFSLLFEKIQQPIDFQLEASGFFSTQYSLVLVDRPELTKINIALRFPSYINRSAKTLHNVGSLKIPEGTTVTWILEAANTDNASILFASSNQSTPMSLTDNTSFRFAKTFKNPDQYSVLLENKKSKNKNPISYAIDIIKDQYPQITIETLRDSVLFNHILLGGTLTDDYGLSTLTLNYQIISGDTPQPYKTNPITLGSTDNEQRFFFRWAIDSLHLNPGDKLNYHLQVWDNDAVNGHKSTRSTDYVFVLPSDAELKAALLQAQQSTQKDFNKTLKRAKSLQEAINQTQKKLKGKEEIGWSEKKMLENLIQQKNELEKAISELQKANTLLDQKKETFSTTSEKLKEKSEQLQKLLNELFDEQTKQLFQEMEKLLNKGADSYQLQKWLDKLDRKEIGLEKELERTFELFKQLQYDYKLEQAIETLKELHENQEELLQKTIELADEKSKKVSSDGHEKDNPSRQSNTDKNNSTSQESVPQNLAKEQETIKKETHAFQNTIEELKKLEKSPNDSKDLPTNQDLQEVEQWQQQSKESLEEDTPQKAIEQQKKATTQLQNMKEKLKNMQNSSEMEIDLENLETLRHILHGLIKLSYDQETLMKGFNQILSTDPHYHHLSQEQLSIKENAKVLEDSLLSLSKKDLFLNSFVTREIGELHEHLDHAINHLKERKKAFAGSEMQLSMTSINNLALMLNDHFDTLSELLARAKLGAGKGKKKNKGMEFNLSEHQQKLNQQIEQLKKGGKSGRSLSEEFARIAAEQERIRRALQEMQEKLKKEGGQIPGNDLPSQMEKTEIDLVNKQITEQTLRRQNEIVTRLLETEKSMREQNEEEERKGETANEHSPEVPKSFEKYLQLKEKEVELLKTVPPKLIPYYKNEVIQYFKRIGTKE